MARPEAFRGGNFAMRIVDLTEVPEGGVSGKAYLAAHCRRGSGCFLGRPDLVYEVRIPNGMPRDLILSAVREGIAGSHAHCGEMSVTQVR